ncbi:MAG: EI24 domain-containing protein [Deltaproteobacteria bacterium]|nr:EI24 domain-containing protein [Deltaproteobacteria bacterium]
MSASLPDVAGGSFLDRVLAGARFAAGGVMFTLRHFRVLRWALVPMVIQVAIFVGLVALGLAYVDDAAAALGPAPGHWYSFLGAVLEVALVVLLLIVGAVATLLVGGVVCDPFYDGISEATESILLARDVGEPFTVAGVLRGVLRELGATVLRLTLYLGVAIPLWILGLTGIGSIVALPASLAWTWFFVAIEGLARSQARHKVPGGQRFSAVFQHKALALGFGAAGWLFAYIPLTAPFLIVGGTRLFLSLAAHDRVPSTLSLPDKARLKGP